MKKQEWVVIQGLFYVSGRYHKTIQRKMIPRLEWLMYYGCNYDLLHEGSKNSCKEFITSHKS